MKDSSLTNVSIVDQFPKPQIHHHPLLFLLGLDLRPQHLGLLDIGDVSEQRGICDAQTFETVAVTLLREVLVKCTPTHVDKVAADLAAEFNAKAMELVEPKWYRLSVP